MVLQITPYHQTGMGLIPSISNHTGISPIPTSYTVTLHINFLAIYSPAIAYRVKTPVHARGKVLQCSKSNNTI